MRFSREQIHMLTAVLWGKRSTCKRPDRQIGCVITDVDMKRIVSIGYNGPPAQLGNDACRGQDAEGTCGCLHAEMNAISKVDSSLTDKVMFVTMAPCETCASMIAQSGIWRVYYLLLYRNNSGLELLAKCSIITEQLGLQKQWLHLLGEIC